jgi:hypothetical protein
MTLTNKIEKKSWEEFRATGLFLFINNFLHIFGWCIVIELDNNKLVNVYPARTSLRGFSAESTTKAYIAISEYMNKTSETLLNESKE